MTARTGIRKIEHIEGGVIAWLYPGGADLDEVLVEIARFDEYSQEEWWDFDDVRAEGPDPAQPEALYSDETASAWRHYWDHRAPYVSRLEEEHPTRLTYVSGEVYDVGYYRRLPWCTCGEDHAWHYEPAQPGPGAMLAVVVGGAA